MITLPLEELAREDQSIDLSEVGEIDWDETRRLAELGYRDQQKWVLNFNKTLSDREFIGQIHSMIRILEKVYQHPIDIEFTINKHQDQKSYQSAAVQPCDKKRGTTYHFRKHRLKGSIDEAKGHFMGGNVC